MKLLHNKNFILTIILIFIFLLVSVYYFGCHFGISQSESFSIIANAILMLLATFIAISLPILVNMETEQQENSDEIKATYISIARYIGEELADNIVRVEHMKSVNDKTISELSEKLKTFTREQKAQQLVGIWKGVADELVFTLEDTNHKSLIMSGILTKYPNIKINSEIKDAYSKMTNLKQTSRRISIFFGMILSPPPDIPTIFITDLLNTKVPESIEAIEADIDYFLESAKVTIKEINVTIKPHKMKVEIITYAHKKRKNKKH